MSYGPVVNSTTFAYTGCGASAIRCSVELDRRVTHELRPPVRCVDDAHGARLRAHDEALGAGTVGPVAHASQQFAVGDTGRGEEHVVAGDEVVDGEHLVEVVAGVERGSLFVL